MTTTLKDAKPCPSCGKPMPSGALAGLCPACLLAQGADTDSGGAGRFVPPSLEEVAKLFPQLEIQGLLGAGGMGAVYKARQPALDRTVALKILPAAGVGGVNFAERFNREARALARLSHPNIVAVHEFGQVGGLHFFIMEFVDGANLRQLGQAGRIAPREALQIIPQICDALQYAHDEGVVHRDIKPENVLVDRKGRVKIADFGLAKILGVDVEALRLTAEGQVMGTLHYMAPEQLEKPLTVDHRADIYSLGVVFYEMLTGDLPLGKFSPPSRKFHLDVRLDDVVLRALENDPARRYQKASDVKSQLETIAGTPEQTTGPSTPGPRERERALPRTPQGTAILPPRTHWRINRPVVLVSLFLVLVAWAVFQKQRGHVKSAADSVSPAVSPLESRREEPELPTQPTVSTELWAPSVAAGEKPDPGKIRDEANELMQRDDYEPALQRHIWLHNHSTEVEPSLSGVRLSFYLSGWVELGRRYPKARQALIEVRDLKTREFDEGRGYSQLFQDIGSINSYLNAEEATASLFKRIHKFDPMLAAQCIHYAKEALVKSREYELCLGYIPDVQNDFERHVKNHARDHQNAAKNKWMDTPEFRKSADARFAKGVSQLIQMLRGAGRVDEAESIRTQAAAIVDDSLLATAASEDTGGSGKTKISIVSKADPFPTPKAPSASVETWAPTVVPGESLDLFKLLEAARSMITARDYESALQRFIWLHNHAKQNGGDPLGGVADWVELGRRFPKAKQALIEIRDWKAYRFEQGQGYFELFSQVWMINRFLGEEDATTRLFIRVHQLDPALARQCIGYARETLVKRKEYELCLSYIPDVQADVESSKRNRELELGMATRGTLFDSPELRRSADIRFVTNASQLIEMLKGVGRLTEAERIRVQAAAVVNAPEFRVPTGVESPTSDGGKEPAIPK